MIKSEMQKKEVRIDTVRKKMEKIPAMLDGVLLNKRNRVKRKDGSIHISPEYHTFQYRGTDGLRKWKRIPRKARASVEKLVLAAKRYNKLEQEYTALMTELSLAGGNKKKTIK